MGKPAARITDFHQCPLSDGPVPHVGGPIISGAMTVLIGGLPAARVSDQAICVGPIDEIIEGSTGVFIEGLPAARMGDKTAHGGTIVVGDPTVLIGDTMEFSGLETALNFVLGLIEDCGGPSAGDDGDDGGDDGGGSAFA